MKCINQPQTGKLLEKIRCKLCSRHLAQSEVYWSVSFERNARFVDRVSQLSELQAKPFMKGQCGYWSRRRGQDSNCA